MQTITVGGNTYNLVPLPASPGVAAYDDSQFDAIALNVSPYDLSQETQQWPGADGFMGTVTLPPMSAATAAPWAAFLAELRGALNVFQLQDPKAPPHPLGNTAGSEPVVDAGVANLPTQTILGTKGWAVGQHGVLLAGDRIQVGYRYYIVCETASSDASGKAQLVVWPSLRETPAGGTPLVLKCPKMLMRLASNARRAQWSPRGLTTRSFACMEVRP